MAISTFSERHEWVTYRFYEEMVVIFQGFRASLSDLMATGWQLRTETPQRVTSFLATTRVVLIHENLSLVGLSMPVSDRPMGGVIKIEYVSSHRSLYITGAPPAYPRVEPRESTLQQWVDCKYNRGLLESWRFCDIFQPSQEMVIEDPSIDDMLSRIIDEQRPHQAELREKARKKKQIITPKVNILTLS